MHLYVNDPVFGNALLKLAPGAMVPESQRPESDVDVCEIESLFVHVTVPPCEIVTGFGLYAFVVNVREFITIDTLVDAFDGVLGLELLLHARLDNASPTSTHNTARLIRCLLNRVSIGNSFAVRK